MGIPFRTLIIEDSENDALLLVRTLQKGGYDLKYERVEATDEMGEALKKRHETSFGRVERKVVMLNISDRRVELNEWKEVIENSRVVNNIEMLLGESTGTFFVDPLTDISDQNAKRKLMGGQAMKGVTILRQSQSGKQDFPLRLFAAAFAISIFTAVFAGWFLWQEYNRRVRECEV